MNFQFPEHGPHTSSRPPRAVPTEPCATYRCLVTSVQLLYIPWSTRGFRLCDSQVCSVLQYCITDMLTPMGLCHYHGCLSVCPSSLKVWTLAKFVSWSLLKVLHSRYSVKQRLLLPVMLETCVNQIRKKGALMNSFRLQVELGNGAQ